MERSKKEALVAELHQTFVDSNLVVVTHQAGMTVAEMSALRVRMREVGASFTVTKNRLARIALAGTKFEGLADSFTGP
ncbi:MAG: 50S ribosomal protein L10, partial [Alphaproteobacteria bacterium]